MAGVESFGNLEGENLKTPEQIGRELTELSVDDFRQKIQELPDEIVKYLSGNNLKDLSVLETVATLGDTKKYEDMFNVAKGEYNRRQEREKGIVLNQAFVNEQMGWKGNEKHMNPLQATDNQVLLFSRDSGFEHGLDIPAETELGYIEELQIRGIGDYKKAITDFAVRVIEGRKDLNMSAFSDEALHALTGDVSGTNLFKLLDYEERDALTFITSVKKVMVERGIYFQEEDQTWESLKSGEPFISETQDKLNDILNDDIGDIGDIGETQDKFREGYNALQDYINKLRDLDISLRRKQRIGGVHPEHGNINALARNLQGKLDSFWSASSKFGRDFQDGLE